MRHFKFIILSGNIGSGKSTLCKALAKEGFLIISRDSLRYMIGGGTYKFHSSTEPFIHSANMAVVREAVEKGFNIVMDECCINKHMRSPFIELCEEWGYSLIALVMFRLGKKESVDRRMTNPHDTFDRKVWENVWERFDSLYQKPTIEEGFHKVIELDKTWDITQLRKELK